jgi:predicted lipase
MTNDSSDTMESNDTASQGRSTLRTTLNLAKDGVVFAKPAVSAGFGIAQACVNLGFSIPRKLVPIKSPIDMAYSITTRSLRFSNAICQSSLDASERMLSLAGAESGETYRILQDYVNSQSHVDGHDTREALLGVAALLVEVGFLDVTKNNPMVLMQGASKLAVLHQEQRQERISARNVEMNVDESSNEWSTSLYVQYATAIYGAQAALLGCCGTTLLEKELIVPHPSELSSLSRHLRFAAAAYGARSMKFMGVCDNLAYWTSDSDAIVTLCGIQQNGGILHMAQERHELYRPAHFVAIDHEHKEVIVTIRGTMSLHDVLVDLVCKSVDFESVFDHDAAVTQGKAHGGFLKSAQTLACDLHELVAETLQANPFYEIVVVGHSLGGGVATILSLLWARIPLFRTRRVRAISYASPCVLCKTLSQAPFTRRHVTSVVTGDDIVSRFGLATFREMQQKMLSLATEGENMDDEMNCGNDSDSVTTKVQETLPPQDDDKLYCAGRVWWLESKEYEPHPIVEVDPTQDLNEIGLFPDMFAIHLPTSYLDSLDKLDRHQSSSEHHSAAV